MTAPRPHLHALAERLGVVDVFHDLGGTERRTSDATRATIVGAMGFDGGSEDAAERALRGLERTRRERLMAPARVWRELADAAPALDVVLPRAGTLHGELVLLQENGREQRLPLRLACPAAGARLRVPLPRPPMGEHELSLAGEIDGEPVEGRQRLFVAPRSALRAREVLGDRAAAGVQANLYAVRSERNGGHGDLGDLTELVQRTGRWGGDFVGINPLHALRNRGTDYAPYSPTSRLYRNRLYLRVDDVPELARSAPARALLAERGRADALARLRAAPTLDHAALCDLVEPVLAALHRTFAERAGQDDERNRAWAAFREREGQALVDFATFEALREHETARRGEKGADWRTWSAELRDPRSAAVERFRRERAEDVERACWIQFELERQLGLAASAAERAGLAVGLVLDLATGSPPASADAWAFPRGFARGVSQGAPPDAFTPDGQDWGLAPLDPHALREGAYRLWKLLVRGSLRHAGGLRIDHAIGLLRAFWIPEGRPGAEGAYVRQPFDDLLGILAIESRRQRALIVGEDLGNVPAGLSETLGSWGLLSTKVLLFERDGERYKSAASYSPRALVTATSHDLVPLAGYFEGTDLATRHGLGGIDDAGLAAGLADRARQRAGLTARLAEQGLATPDDAAEAPVAGAYRFLSRTPAALVAVALDDLAGEREPINLPGVPVDDHPSWSRRMELPLERIPMDPELMPERLRPRPVATPAAPRPR